MFLFQDPWDAFLGLYENGSVSDDDEWIGAQLSSLVDTDDQNQQKNILPEPQAGNIEFKRMLINPTELRLRNLISQVCCHLAT